MSKLILGPTPAFENGNQLPTPAALEYVAGNLRRPSQYSLPESPTAAVEESQGDSEIQFNDEAVPEEVNADAPAAGLAPLV